MIVGGFGLPLTAGPVVGQEARLSYEIEFGFGSEFSKDTRNGQISKEVYLKSDINLEYFLSDQVIIFADIVRDFTFEIEDGERTNNGATELENVGLRYELGSLTIELGKITPQFGYAKETDLGYFGDGLIQDYELDPGYGILAKYSHENQQLRTSLFSINDDADEWDRLRGVALQYEHTYAGGIFHVGARSLLSGGASAVREVGFNFGLTAENQSGFEMIAEAAFLRRRENPDEDWRFALLGTRYSQGPAIFSGVYSQRHIGSQPVEHLVALSVDWELDKGSEISFGIAREFTSEGRFSQVGFSITRTFDK